MMAEQPRQADFSMDVTNLYREDMFTDQAVGAIRRLTPVDTDGNDDPARPTLYVGSAQVLTPAGALPLSFEIEADSLADAAQKFGDAAQVSLEQTMQELRELQREAASSIVVPGQGGPGGGMPGGGGMPPGLAGGGFKMP